MTIAECRYLHDTHLECHSLDQAMDILLARGCVLSDTGLAYDFPHQDHWGNRVDYPGTLSYHFFGEDGREVASYCAAMSSVVPGLTIWDSPRTWGDDTRDAHRRVELGGYIEQYQRRKMWKSL